ncbi:hypothetical protein OEZ86_014469 [Tetradesmus obliquus]|nr:hypothetical protein OEZ86_014469 [Tetradesmus obliquus]
MAEVLLRQRAESEAAAGAAAAATAAAAAAAAEPAAESAAEPAAVSEPESLNRGQLQDDHAPMPTCAGLLRNIIWRKQTGYSRLVDSSSQDQDKKTQ